MRASWILPLALLSFSSAFGQEIWKDSNQPIHRRVDDLVGRMTLQEKIGQMINSAPSIPRLGIPRYEWWSEALHGVLKPAPCTSFPEPIGLGATFDTKLEFSIATAISDEARARFHDERRRGVEKDDLGLDFWAPNINIFRDPRWGRGQETYGEDPYLTGQMAIQFVQGMQGDDPKYLKTIATPKHYAVHSGPDAIRYSFNAIATPRDMWLTYLPAFQNAIVDGGAWSIMGAYNSVNGQPACASDFLLVDTLRNRWHFPGYVVSDCDAIHDIWASHHYTKTAAEAVALSVKKGCDLDCGNTYKALNDAVAQGLITEADIDVSVKRLFEARFRLGLFDPADQVPFTKIPISVAGSPAHVALARKAAQESMVLLKNNGALPLPAGLRVAVIGPNADAHDVLLGNYQGAPEHVVSILEGIRANVPRGRVPYAKGCDITSLSSLEAIPTVSLRTPDGKPGLKGEYFNNMKLEGVPDLIRNDPEINFDWGQGSPGRRINYDGFSARWTGKLLANETGPYRIGMTNDDGMRVWINGELILDDWRDDAARTSSKTINLVAGRMYDLKVEYYDNKVYAAAKLLWSTPHAKPFGDAIDAAKSADVVVLVLGISGDIENESHDRDFIDLPQIQRDLLKAVQKSTKKPIILVLVNGGPLSLGADEMKCAAILEAWYPGQEGGNAVADVLFGKVSPSGRLPVTVVKSMKDLPPMDSYTMKARTYRYPGPQPQFPFGYGLSYTSFVYSGLSLPGNVASGQPIVVSARVRNSGLVESDEVVQVYRHFQSPSKPMPEQQLIAFMRVHLKAGEQKSVSFSIPAERLAVLGDDTFLHAEAGKIDISLGGGQPSFSQTVNGTMQVRLRGIILHLEPSVRRAKDLLGESIASGSTPYREAVTYRSPGCAEPRRGYPGSVSPFFPQP
jgi:beta-glucosidase